MAFQPVVASRNITEKYRRYLLTTFRIGDPDYNQQFQRLLEKEGSIAKGPYLNISDEFVQDKTIDELIKEGLLSEEFYKIDSSALPVYERRLYKHQTNSLRQVISGENIVVSTGTGSGKTECFVLPIINHLMREKEKGTLGPGVRAIMIYPMNALANDQVSRFRKLLKNYEEITFGCYTGQTRETEKEAIENYKSLHEQLPLKNEMVSREKMRKEPPHILITNYAMLEYLLIRPGDKAFFTHTFAEDWQFVVLDEAHVYNGAKGIEVAMLLRRLKGAIKEENLQFILTSATLGDKKANKNVADFAINLCGADFEANNIIRGETRSPKPNKDLTQLDISFYNKVAKLIRENASDEAILPIIEKYDSSIDRHLPIEEILYEVILHDELYFKVRNSLDNTTKSVYDIAKQLEISQDDLVDFITVVSSALKHGRKLFDARYHMFIRALEGAYITLNPNKKLFINRKETHYEKDDSFKVYEAGICRYCNSLYVFGEEENGYLKAKSVFDDVNEKSVYLINAEAKDENDDTPNEEYKIEVEEYYLCSKCGAIQRVCSTAKFLCDCGEKYVNKVRKVKTKEGKLHKCVVCERTETQFGVIRSFFAGQEAVTSVIGTALYEELPSFRVITKSDNDLLDRFGFDLEDCTIEEKEELPKQFLTFSDSRQAAAFFASYFQNTYDRFLYKRLIVETAKKNEDILLSKGQPLNDFAEDLTACFENLEIGESQNQLKEAWKALLVELYDKTSKTSLENLCLIGFEIEDIFPSDNEKLGLTRREANALFKVLADNFRNEFALNYAEVNMTKKDKNYYTFNGIENNFSLSNKKNYCKSWLPMDNTRSNTRLDYISKIFPEWNRETCMDFAKYCWHKMVNNKIIQGTKGDQYKLEAEKMRVVIPERWYYCSKCKKTTMHNVKGICPTFTCDGVLREIDLDDILGKDHYRQMFLEMAPYDLKVVEHTAQLSQKQAYQYQKEFQNKEINVLSCSTTFEMGVDVGSLETVFMRNMPPSPANYAQRSGRAGRSIQSAAYALTFCNKSSHDLSYFNNPVAMIKGKIDPPRFVVTNDKIVIRHIYASALSFFWKKYPEYCDKVVVFMGEGVQEFKSYLLTKPEDLQRYLDYFVPQELKEVFLIDRFGWVEGLIGEDGRLNLVVKEYKEDIKTITDVIDGTIEKRKQGQRANFFAISRLERLQRTLEDENIITFLSRKNIIPKYGFPVDTVGLQYSLRSEETKLGLSLERDLMLAISEYAPSSQIVADGNLITSRYLKKISGKEWPKYDYKKCSECQTLNIERHIYDAYDETSTRLKECKLCHELLDTRERTRTFIIPQFGFIMDKNIEVASFSKPEMTFRGDVSYIGYEQDIVPQEYEINGQIISLSRSRNDKLAVLNESKFFICDSCGYGLVDKKEFGNVLKKEHENPSGYKCQNNILKRASLGHIFKTDVVQIRFLDANLRNGNIALSVLYGLLEGISRYLDIERDEISGCLQWYYNPKLTEGNYSLIIFDTTPGGAGHVRRIDGKDDLEGVLQKSLMLVKSCNCGGEEGDSSCYSCLRNYYNQRQHDLLKRSYVVDFIENNFVKHS